MPCDAAVQRACSVRPCAGPELQLGFSAELTEAGSGLCRTSGGFTKCGVHRVHQCGVHTSLVQGCVARGLTLEGGRLVYAEELACGSCMGSCMGASPTAMSGRPLGVAAPHRGVLYAPCCLLVGCNSRVVNTRRRLARCFPGMPSVKVENCGLHPGTLANSSDSPGQHKKSLLLRGAAATPLQGHVIPPARTLREDILLRSTRTFSAGRHASATAAPR
eukprot:358542-Chlamydomonas_euryale.AAC.4